MYYYTRNGQGDIIGIIDNTGTVIARYIYDAWGDLEKITDGNGVGKTADTSFIGYKNPFRYRGYYYDTETGLYYCQSRYYDPVTGRFLNADVYASTGQGFTGYNMYAYCGNNPVMRYDPTGEFFVGALIAVVATATIATLTSCSSKANNKSAVPSNYKSSSSKSQNCYSYAFGLSQAANPGDYSVDPITQDYMYKDKKSYTTKEITAYIQRDMKNLNKSVRVVSNPSDKKSNEYIVAMKTSDIIIPEIECADYHFAVQLSDGTWADKPGGTPSRWNELDGTSVTWDLNGYCDDYYNTESIYFAVVK